MVNLQVLYASLKDYCILRWIEYINCNVEGHTCMPNADLLSIFSFNLLQITFFSFPVFPVLLFLPVFLYLCLLRDPPLAFSLLAGNLRLQQIVNPIDPLEILADVHWTHICQKEEEEKVGPTSKSSTSRGNHVHSIDPLYHKGIWFPFNAERPILRPSSCCF